MNFSKAKMKKIILMVVMVVIVSIGWQGAWGQTKQKQSTAPVSADMTSRQHEIQATKKPIDTYDFPIKPGTEAWKSFRSYKQMTKACQIPEDILKKMSTEGLIETCLSYPFLPNMLMFNNLQTGFNSIVSSFNGLQELLKREDAGTKLLARYCQIRKLDRQSIQKEFSKFPTFYFRCFEILISQDVVLSKLSKKEKVELLRECIWKYHEKQKYPDTYGYISKEKHKVNTHETLLIIGRLLQNEDYKPFKLKIQDKKYLRDFLDGAVWISDTDEILPEAEKFLENRQKEEKNK